jgi:exonuclease VII large subunit
LGRGYALVTNARGAAVRRADDAKPGESLRVRAAEVTFDAQVVAVHEAERR